MQPEDIPDAPDPEWTSGPWTGFYIQDGRHRQDLHLTFSDGRLTGEGLDGIGLFLVKGSYDTASKEVWWTKRYVGGHDVHYRGFRELEGIWGTWRIHAGLHGGFHIWPLGGGGDRVGREAVEAPQEQQLTGAS